MKRALIGIGFVLAIMAGASLFPGRAQEASQTGQQPPASGAPPLNPLKVALLKWYLANLTTSFKVGRNPYAIAFDGANMWVTNYYDSTVSKLRASDGANLGTFNVGGAPMGVAFDGANIWVVNSSPNTVTKLRASDGANLGEFAVGKVPFNAAFDGEAIWVTNTQGASVTKLRASDGKVLGTFTDTGGPIAIICDGTYMWASSFNSVSRFRLDGRQAGTFKVHGAYSLAFDGTNIWVPSTGGPLTKLRASDGKVLATYNVGADGSGIAFDGVNLWFTAGAYIGVMRRTDGKVLLTKLLGGVQGIAFDGANVWVANWEFGRANKL
jgi:PQQ-like domain